MPMPPILTRCGYRCDLCLAYKPNVARNPANQQKLSDGWHKYFGFRIPPSATVCDGCMSENPKLIDQSCPVRPCVIARGLENCAQCQDYVCEKLTQRLVACERGESVGGAESASGILLGCIRLYAGGEKIGEWSEIPEDDYRCFIQPYENKSRLEEIRNL